MADTLEDAKDRYLNQWKHCDRRLHAQDAKIRCECGQTWDWIGTLGSTMEMLATLEEITSRAVSALHSQNDSSEVSLF